MDNLFGKYIALRAAYNLGPDGWAVLLIIGGCIFCGMAWGWTGFLIAVGTVALVIRIAIYLIKQWLNQEGTFKFHDPE